VDEREDRWMEERIGGWRREQVDGGEDRWMDERRGRWRRG
jgi:hypothetical protein